MNQSKKAKAGAVIIPDGYLIPRHANSNRQSTLLNEIYQKQAEIATLAGTILNHDLNDEEVSATASQLKCLAERSLHNCEELELISKTMPSQAK